MKKIIYLLALLFLPRIIFCQTVVNTSYVASNGERVLRLETEIPISKKETWKFFSTKEGLRKWIAPVVSLDFKVGGEIRTNYDSTKTVNDAGTIHLPIINYLDGEILTLKVILNKTFPDKAREEDKNLQEIIQLVDLENNKTKIISSMVGWGNGADWDKTYEFFKRGNEWTFKQLIKATH